MSAGAGEPRIVDISPAIGVGAPVYPGDTPLAIDVTFDPASGDAVTVCRVTMSAHTGAHADAPVHVGAGPVDAAALPLDAFWGPCVVVDLRGTFAVDAAAVRRALAVAGADAPGGGPCARLLVRTLEAPPATFPDAFPHFTRDGAAVLVAAAREGLRLVGIDTFSVDAVDSKDLPVHRALFGAGIVLLEGLDLSRAAAGPWELVALPLKLVGADASPVRAALRRLA